MAYYFILLAVFFLEQTFLFWWSPIYPFFMDCVFDALSEKSLPNQVHKSSLLEVL